MIKRRLFVGLLLWGFAFVAMAQTTTITLQSSVDMALSRNIQLKMLQNTVGINKIGLLQSKLSYLPSLNAQMSFQRNFGTSFNFVTFQRTSQANSSANPGATLSIPIFGGMKKYYTYKQSIHRVKSAEVSLQKNANSIITSVLQAYLQVVFLQGNIKISESRTELLEKQRERLQKLVDAGVGTMPDLLNLKSQLATEQLNLVNQQTAFSNARLSLLQLLQQDVNGNYVFIVPDSTEMPVLDDVLPSLNEVEQYALENMPEVAEQLQQIAIAHYNMRLAQSSYYPTLGFSAGINSTYNTQSLRPGTNPFSQVKDTKPYPFYEQWKDNFSQFFSFSLQIPIFNGYATRSNVQVQRLNEKNAELNLKSVQDQMIRAVQQAYLDVKNARTKYDAVLVQRKALEEAYRFANEKFNAGAISYYTYYETLNNKLRAETDLLQARYDYFFKRKLLDVYQGKTIRF